MRYCVLCRKRAVPGNGTTFFNAPPSKKAEWAKLCKKEFNTSARICIDHFHKDDVATSGSRFILLPKAVPILPQQYKSTVSSVPTTIGSTLRNDPSLSRPQIVNSATAVPNESFFHRKELSSSEELLQQQQTVSSNVPTTIGYTLRNDLSLSLPQIVNSATAEPNESFFHRKELSSSAELLQQQQTVSSNVPTTIGYTLRNDLSLPLPQIVNSATAVPNESFFHRKDLSSTADLLQQQPVSSNVPTTIGYMLRNDLSLPRPQFVNSATAVPNPCLMECHEFEDLQKSVNGLRFFTYKELTTTAASKWPEPQFKEKESQTDPSIFDIVTKKYKEKIRQLEAKNRDLRCELLQANLAINAMKKIFTEGQIRSLMTPGNVKWRWNDVSTAVCLHASGPRAYNHLHRKGFPLPHVSTLQRWCRNVDISQGILKKTIDFMGKDTDLSLDEKLCVLSFDEMKVEETYEYDQLDDVARKPANYVQVVMARGLKKSWKHPIFYDFDCRITIQILSEIIERLNRSGFPVVAVVCDMGPTNRKLWREMGVTPDKPWFSNPTNMEEKVFVFMDAPHLLKLIRNLFLDSGLIYEETLLNSRAIWELIRHTSKSDVSIKGPDTQQSVMHFLDRYVRLQHPFGLRSASR